MSLVQIEIYLSLNLFKFKRLVLKFHYHFCYLIHLIWILNARTIFRGKLLDWSFRKWLIGNQLLR